MIRSKDEEVFRGYFEECLIHLRGEIAKKYPPRSKKLSEVRVPIAEFCGVGIQSIDKWLRGYHLPRGEQYIRMMCYLHVVGYRVIELENMPKNRRFFLELLGYGLISGNEAANLLGFNEPASLYKVLNDNQSTSEEKTKKMWDIWKERKEDLDLAKVAARQRYRLGQPLVPQPAPVQPVEVKDSQSEDPIARQKAVLSIMDGLASLLEEGSFEEALKAELSKDPVAVKTVLRLWAQVNEYSFWLIRNQARSESDVRR